MTVAVVGLGQMGSAFAERLLDAGYDVVVANRTPGRASDLVERGATELGIDEVWAKADTCVVSVGAVLWISADLRDDWRETRLLRLELREHLAAQDMTVRQFDATSDLDRLRVDV